jgi:hypothetical protein
LRSSEIGTLLTEVLTILLLSTQTLVPNFFEEITHSLVELLPHHSFLLDFAVNLYTDLINNCSIDNTAIPVDNVLKQRGLKAIFTLLSSSIFSFLIKDAENFHSTNSSEKLREKKGIIFLSSFLLLWYQFV